VRTIEIAGVDVIHPRRDSLAQHGQCSVAIRGWTENAGPSELHRTVPEPFYGAIAEYECARLVNGGHNHSLKFSAAGGTYVLNLR